MPSPEQSPADPADPADDAALVSRAEAAYAAGDLEGAVTGWEQLHSARVAGGDHEGAAEAACRVALHLLCDTGLMSPVRGWLVRAERLLDEDGDPQPARASVAMVRGYERFLSGDDAAAERAATEAVELGDRLGVLPAVVVGRTALGRLRILAGDVEQGLSLLDEVAAQLMSGEVDAFTSGIMYCELICAAQGLGLHDRAREWTDVMQRWGQTSAVGAIQGRCRVHRAELLRLSGPGEAAEDEAMLACDELRPWLRREFGWPLVELGTIRLLRGDLPGAEEALLEAHRQVWSPQPALALLRLVQGHPDVALALINDAVERPSHHPSKEQPPFGDLRLAPLLAAQVEIAQAVGEVALAGRASATLDAIATRYPGPGLAAAAALARARVALLRDDVDPAVAAGESAVQRWVELGAPYEAAVARVVLGAAHQRAGRHEQARLEWQAAREGFEAFGAHRALAQVETLLQGDRGAVSPPPRPTEAGVASFVRVDDWWRVTFRGVEVTVADLKGFRHLARLLAEPGREFHVLDLVALEHPRAGGAVGAHDAHETGVRRGADLGLPVLDEQAKAAYRRRVREVEEEIDEATGANDLGRLALAERDRDFLLAELARAVGLHGRDREVGGTQERARTSVTRSLRYALRRLVEAHPELGRHLDQHVHTGTCCSYLPDPLTPIEWVVSAAGSPPAAGVRPG